MTPKEKINRLEQADWHIQRLYAYLEDELKLRDCDCKDDYSHSDSDEFFHFLDNALDWLWEWKKNLRYEENEQEAI